MPNTLDPNVNAKWQMFKGLDFHCPSTYASSSNILGSIFYLLQIMDHGVCACMCWLGSRLLRRCTLVDNFRSLLFQCTNKIGLTLAWLAVYFRSNSINCSLVLQLVVSNQSGPSSVCNFYIKMVNITTINSSNIFLPSIKPGFLWLFSVRWFFGCSLTSK